MQEIKDSGARRQFYDKNGNKMAQRDIQEGKGAEYLLPMDIISSVYSFKREHYSDLELCPLVEEDLFFYIDKFMKLNNTDFIYHILLRFMQKEYNGSIETAIMELAVHYEKGARKYSEYNWTKGLPTHCFLDSGLRHALKYFRGDKDEPHERAFMWNLVGLLWTRRHKPELDDIFYGDDYSSEKIDEYNEKIKGESVKNVSNEISTPIIINPDEYKLEVPKDYQINVHDVLLSDNNSVKLVDDNNVELDTEVMIPYIDLEFEEGTFVPENFGNDSIIISNINGIGTLTKIDSRYYRYEKYDNNSRHLYIDRRQLSPSVNDILRDYLSQIKLESPITAVFKSWNIKYDI